MGQEEEHEPVFIRSKWGTNRYVYNPNNPVGLSLIVGQGEHSGHRLLPADLTAGARHDPVKRDCPALRSRVRGLLLIPVIVRTHRLGAPGADH